MLKPGQMLQYWVKSFYSADFYREVIGKWQGIGALYLLLLLIVTMIPYTIVLENEVKQYFHESIPEHIKTFPDIRIIDGEVKFDKSMPYHVKNEKGKVIITIDTTGKINSLKGTSAHTLLTKNKLHIRNSAGKEEIISLKNHTMFLTQANLYRLIDRFVFESMVLLYFIGLISFYVVLLLMALIFSLFVLGLAKFKQVTIGKVTALRLAVVALAPPIFVNLLLASPLGLPIYTEEIVFCSVYAAFLVFAVNSIKVKRVKKS